MEVQSSANAGRAPTKSNMTPAIVRYFILVSHHPFWLQIYHRLIRRNARSRLTPSVGRGPNVNCVEPSAQRFLVPSPAFSCGGRLGWGSELWKSEQGGSLRPRALANKRPGAVSFDAMSAFHKIIANVRSALAHQSQPAVNHDHAPREIVPIAPSARRAELVSEFARELERVGGHFLGMLSPAETCEVSVASARELAAKTVAPESPTTEETSCAFGRIPAPGPAGLHPLR